MPGTVSRGGADFLQQFILGIISSAAWEVRLCNNFLPDMSGTVTADFTEIGASYTRWQPLVGDWFGAGGDYQTAAHTFLIGAPSFVGEKVYGFFLVDTLSNTQIWAEMFSGPWPIPIGGGSFDLGLHWISKDCP